MATKRELIATLTSGVTKLDENLKLSVVNIFDKSSATIAVDGARIAYRRIGKDHRGVGSNLRCAAVRSAVAWRTERDQQWR
jgi:hypothetical protein